jgi:hypothetical protein
MKRIKHNDLTHYFLRDHKDLPRAYLASCEKFFKELGTKRQASSTKPQAPSCKLDGWPDSGYNRIIKEKL